MTDIEDVMPLLSLSGNGLRRQRDNVKWVHPGGPFTYLFGRDSLSGRWGWRMRNDLLDRTGHYTSSGELVIEDNSPAAVASAILVFIDAEVTNLREPQ